MTTIPPGTRLGRVAVADGVRVDLTGSEEPSFDAAAQLVYSLTELPGIKRVSLRFNGKPCCVYTHDGQPVEVLTRASFRGWQGEPCELRESPSAPCGSDRRLVPGRFERPTLEGNIEGTNPRRRVGRARYAVRSARCRGEGRIIEGARFYACRITWTDGHSRRVCVGRSLRPGSSHAYLPLGRCQRPRTPPPAGVDP